MCAMASSMPGSVAMATMGARYSAYQSSSVASFTPFTPAFSRIAFDSGQARISTPFCREHLPDGRQHRGRDGLRDEQGLHRVAGAVALGLRVLDDGERLGRVGARVDVDVADAVEVLDDGHARLLRDALDEALAAARHDHVHVLLRRDQLADGRAVRGADELDRRLRQARGLEAERAGTRRWPGWSAATRCRRAGWPRCRSSGTARPHRPSRRGATRR